MYVDPKIRPKKKSTDIWGCFFRWNGDVHTFNQLLFFKGFGGISRVLPNLLLKMIVEVLSVLLQRNNSFGLDLSMLF